MVGAVLQLGSKNRREFGVFVECGPEKPHARVNTGDVWVIQLRPGSTLLAGKVLQSKAMGGFAELFVLYDMRFDEGYSVRVILDSVSKGGPVLMAPLLVDRSMVQIGLVRKIGKATVSEDELHDVRMISTPYSARVRDDHPLCAYFNAELGGYVLNDRSREIDYVVDWRGKKARNDAGQLLGIWGTVPNAWKYESMALEALAARQ